MAALKSCLPKTYSIHFIFPVHWCEEMKRFFQGSSKWLCMKTNIGYGIFRNTLSNNPVCSGHKTVCYWYPTRQDCETELPFAKVGLTCGEDNWYVNGETGYEDKDSWCSEVRANLTASYVKCKFGFLRLSVLNE